jgi:hypothetical protein
MRGISTTLARALPGLEEINPHPSDEGKLLIHNP